MWKFMVGVASGLVVGLTIQALLEPTPIATVRHTSGLVGASRKDCTDATKKDLIWTKGVGFDCVDKPRVGTIDTGLPATQSLYQGNQFGMAGSFSTVAPATSSASVVCARLTPEGLLATSYQPCRTDPKTGECFGECITIGPDGHVTSIGRSDDPH